MCVYIYTHVYFIFERAFKIGTHPEVKFYQLFKTLFYVEIFLKKPGINLRVKIFLWGDGATIYFS